MAISPNLLKQLRATLLRCGLFSNDYELMAVFIDDRLSPWRDQIPSAESPASRVDAIISFLINKQNASQRNALVLLLRVLSERKDPRDICYNDLAEVANALETELATRYAVIGVSENPNAQGENKTLDIIGQFHLAEPRIPGHFEDRNSEIQQLVNFVGEQKWCGVFGIGGTGKTILAAYVAQKLRKEKGIRVVWLDLSENAAIERVLETLAQSVGHSLRTIPDARQKYGYLRAITEDKRLLVIFDDVNDEKVLETLLKSIGAGNTVLVTSRYQGLRSIRKYDLQVLLLDPLPHDAATRVLLKLANISTALSPTEVEAWTSIAKSVGFLPLALEIISGDLRFRSNRNPQEYLKTYIATGKWLKSEEFSARLRGAIDESFHQLSLDHQRAFACLGVFAGNGFDLKAIKVICGFDSIESAEEFLLILKKRLLIRDTLGDTFSLHPVIRQYAQEKLLEENVYAEQPDRPTGRYVAFYLQLLHQYGGYEWNLRQYQHLIPYETEAINAVNTAFRLWQESNSADFEANFYSWMSIKMTFLISWYLHWRGYWDLRVQFCRRITENLETSGLSIDPASRIASVAGNLYVDRGWVHLRRNELDEAIKCAQRGETLLQLSNDLVFAFELTGQIHLNTGNAQKAYDLFMQLRKDQTENRRIWFVFSLRLADALTDLGNYKEAIQLLENLLSRIPLVHLYENEIISDIRARIAFRLAKLLMNTDELSRIPELLEDATQSFDEAGIVDQTTVAAQVELAKYYLSVKNELTKAQNLLNNALRQAQVIGDQGLVIEVSELAKSITT